MVKGTLIAPGVIQTEAFPLPEPAEGQRRKHTGTVRAIDARVNAEWRRRAEQALRTLIRTTPRFTADDVAVIAGLPPSRNGMGGLFAAAAREGLIVPVGYTTGKRADRHAGIQRVWRKA